MNLVGDVVMNDETRLMVRMIRDNPALCRDIMRLLDDGSQPTKLAALLKHRVREQLRPFLAEIDDFTRAAVMTALSRTVDWMAVVQLAVIRPEDN